MEPTLEPMVWIVERGVSDDGTPWIHYVDIETCEEWVIKGTCNRCGLCVVGAAFPEHYEWHGPPGTPNAVTDLRVGSRLDETVRPSMLEKMRKLAADTPGAIVTGCSLTLGE